MSTWTEIRENVLREIKPSVAEEVTLQSVAEEMVELIDEVLKKSGIKGKAEVHGSVPHGTWIKGQNDLDIFIVLDSYEERSQLGEVLDAIRGNTDWNFTIAFAEHPYLQTVIDGYMIDLVPCFRRRMGEGIKSATDRTPLHTEWLRERLVGIGDEVRLFKQFLKVGGMYGAEIKIGGFSGYLCELLIIKYGSLSKLMESASGWSEHHVVRFNDEKRVFDAPLVVYDPVDDSRNVASALREDIYRKFLLAAKAFIEAPSMRFFMVDETPVDIEELVGSMEGRNLAFVTIEESKAEVPDVLWGMIWKSSNAIERQLTDKGFNVVGTTAWSNDVNRHILVYEVEESNLPEVYKHYGPKDHLTVNVQQFKDAYKERTDLISGPSLEGDTWFVMLRRKVVGLNDVIVKLLVDGGGRIGVSQKLAIKMLQHHRDLEGAEIKPYLVEGFERHMFKFLRGRPYWDE
jgi:tRNA nucleotidyltransferase (CCA-adding enzyme)